MILLSYSTLNELILEPHTWLCKQMGLKRITTFQMREGSQAHRIIQRHISNVEKDARLEAIKLFFPTVETKDFDPATHFIKRINEEYSIHGYMDGLDLEKGVGLEIKTSSTPWGITRFYNLMQWRIAAYAQEWLREMWFISCTRDLKNPIAFKLGVTEKHRKEAEEWIMKGISIIENAEFEYKGVGKSRYCNYENCPFCG